MERRAFVAFVSSGAIGTAGCTDEDVQKITDPLYSTRFQPGTVYEMDINRYPRFSGEFTHTIDTPVHALEVPQLTTDISQSKKIDNDIGFSYTIEQVSPEEKDLVTRFLTYPQYKKYRDSDSWDYISELSRDNISGTQNVYLGDKDTSFLSGPFESTFPCYLLVAPSTINKGQQVDTRLTASVSPGAYARKPPVTRSIEYQASDSSSFSILLELVENASPGAFKIYEGFDVESDYLIYRERLSSGQKEIDLLEILDLDVRLNYANNYMFTIERDDKVERWSMWQPYQSLSVSSPEFNSRVGGFQEDGGEYVSRKRDTVDGNTSITIEVTNTGEVPVALDVIHIEIGYEPDSVGFESYDDIVDETQEYIGDDSVTFLPGETKAVGLPAYSLPELGEVDTVCSGADRTTEITISTTGGYSTTHRIKFSLDTPAKKVELRDLYDGKERYACFSGSIKNITHVEENL